MASQAANSKRRPRVALLGATLGTGNLGVDALGAATVQELVALDPQIEILYQSWTEEPVDIHFGARTFRCEPLVIRRKPNLRQQNGIEQLRRLTRLKAKLGKPLGHGLASYSSTLRRLSGCDAVLDLSAGDSFADIYGETIFQYQADLKLLCLDLGLPLILLPQTIGPFASASVRQTAAEVLSRSTLVCTREAEGVDEIHQLCGEDLPKRIAQTPDVAFVLGPTPTELPEPTEKHLEENGGPLIAVNVSGLLHFGKADFQLAADQADLAMRLVRWALSIENARVLLTPHVVPSPRSPQAAAASPTNDSTDVRACRDVLEQLSEEERHRVDLLEGADTPARAKHAMSRCDFFVGARMHAFIGSASLATPGALLAYSKKAAGVTALVGVEDAVVDLRTMEAQQVVDAVAALYERRDDLRGRLQETVPTIKERVHAFFAAELSEAIGLAPATPHEQPAALA